MPHVVLKGPVTAEDIWLTFRPMEFHAGDTHGKVQDCYLSSEKDTVLLRCLLVERGFSKSFMTRIVEKDGMLTVGLDPIATTERTDALKRFLGFCAWAILQGSPDMKIERSNIEEYVKG